MMSNTIIKTIIAAKPDRKRRKDYANQIKPLNVVKGLLKEL